MTSLVSLQDVRDVGADGGLGDTALQTIIDREEAVLVLRFGDVTGAVIETVPGGKPSLYLARPIASITSVVESLYLGDTAPTTLAATDYYAWLTQGRLERIYGGIQRGMWGAVVVVTYTPLNQQTLWKQVLLELVRIGVNQDTGGSVSGLGYAIRANGGIRDWEAARNTQYARLGWLTN